MKFEEALALHRQGKKVRLRRWPIHTYFKDEIRLSYNDIMSQDWEQEQVLYYDDLKPGDRFTFDDKARV